MSASGYSGALVPEGGGHRCPVRRHTARPCSARRGLCREDSPTGTSEPPCGRWIVPRASLARWAGGFGAKRPRAGMSLREERSLPDISPGATSDESV
eukprot:scaffold1328_cov394-Prasinococcus_capsulatus_cf.AAC.33